MPEPHPLDALLCDLRDTTDALDEFVAAQTGSSKASRAKPTDTTQRKVATQPTGELLSSNARRAGFLLHNASDGTLLVSIGEEEEAGLDTYTYAVGPGETWDTRAVPTTLGVRETVRYAWVTQEPADYPAGVFAIATGGALKVTAFVFPYRS